MNAKDYLKEIIIIDKLIDCKYKQLIDLKQLSGLKSNTYSDTPSMGFVKSDKVAEAVVKIVELENEINKAIDNLVDLKTDAMNKIDSLEDNRYKFILTKKYLENESFEKIAVDLSLSWKWVHKLHKKALEELNCKFFSKVPKSS